MPRKSQVVETIKEGAVTMDLNVYADGRYGYESQRDGVRKRWRFVDLKEASRHARERARLMNAGRPDLLSVRVEELMEFREWKAGRSLTRKVAAVVTEFLAIKDEGAGLNADYRANLGRWLKHFAETMACDIDVIRAVAVEGYLRELGKNARQRNHIRAAIASLFRFARKRGYVPDGTTEAEKVDPLKVRPSGDVSTYTPEELATILPLVAAAYLPWAAIAAFAGIRTEEIRPKAGSKKDGLRWEDFAWSEGYIRVRAETAKTGHGRIVPLLPPLVAWLTPWRHASGPVVAHPVSNETPRLKKLTTLRKNGFRHSFGSYRLAVVKSIHQVAEEMGNSPAVIRKEYQTPMPEAAAAKWFAVLPADPVNVLRMA